jgi:type I restriction enzyme M protein
MLLDLAEATNKTVFKERAVFVQQVKAIERKSGVLLGAPELKAVMEALSEKDETAEVCRDSKGKPEPDSDLRDTENVPLKEDIEEYFAREVLPHVPDAWIDQRKTKTGYEIPLNRHFYRYEPPRPLEEIAADVKALESEILSLLAEITGNGAGAR